MATKIVNIGDGRFIEMTEGGPVSPPKAPVKKTPRKPPGSTNKYVKKKRTLRKGFEHMGGCVGPKGPRKQHDEIPGYTNWVKLRMGEVEAVHPKGNYKSRFGIPNGLTKVEAEKQWKIAGQKAERDIKIMKDAGVLDDTDANAEAAMKATLEVMHSPMDQKMKLAAARQVLEWTKAKPAAKTEMTVNTAEAWLASLADNPEG